MLSVLTISKCLAIATLWATMVYVFLHPHVFLKLVVHKPEQLAVKPSVALG